MKLNKKERELLKLIASLAEKALAARGSARKVGDGPRPRRSRVEAAELRKHVLAARRRNMSVREIADNLGVTPAYVYQLLK